MAPYERWRCVLFFVKYAVGILTGFTLNLCMALSNMDI